MRESPILTPATIRNARTSRRRSAGVKERRRRALDIVDDVDELALRKLLEERNEIQFAAVGIHVVLRKKRVANVAHFPDGMETVLGDRRVRLPGGSLTFIKRRTTLNSRNIACYDKIRQRQESRYNATGEYR